MKTRIIHTKIWGDQYFHKLEHREMIVFLYLISNEFYEKTGVYEIGLDRIALDTKIPLQDVENIIQKFINDDRIEYDGSYIYMKNSLRFQNYANANEKQIENMYRELMAIPKNFREKILEKKEIRESKLFARYFLNTQPVDNQLPTSYQPDIKQKEEIEKEKEQNTKEDVVKTLLKEMDWIVPKKLFGIIVGGVSKLNLDIHTTKHVLDKIRGITTRNSNDVLPVIKLLNEYKRDFPIL